MPAVKRDQLYTVGWIDPSGGKAKGAGHSRSSIVVVAMDPFERIFILYSWAAFCPTDWLINNVFKANARWQPVVFGIDATATQTILVDMLRKEKERREAETGKRIHLPLRPMSLREEKQFSIETTIQPVAAAGRLFRPPEPEVKELKAEFLSFPGGMYRDSLDALACAIRLLPTRPPDVLKAQSREAHRAYLRRIGMSEREIERRLSARDDNG